MVISNIPLVKQQGKDNQLDIDPTVRGAGAVITITGDNNHISIGPGVNLNTTKIMIRGSNCVVSIRERSRFKNGVLYLTDSGTEFYCGVGTSWESGHILVQERCKITLGDDCMLSNGIMIRTSDSHGIFDMDTRELVNPARDVSVGDHVWIGNGARLNKGVSIDKGSIIAQLSVVSGQIEANCVAAGIPAKVIRRGVVWSRSMQFPLEQLVAGHPD
ncbi:acyltransferase [Pararhizobium gei]|uniref:acyltransferase n=1 Tax=Pararhizobium gei TaxID=1395951 RepID=UPI0023DCBAB0|nr:hypothetical protein [Rhizobium gei]